MNGTENFFSCHISIISMRSTNYNYDAYFRFILQYAQDKEKNKKHSAYFTSYSSMLCLQILWYSRRNHIYCSSSIWTGIRCTSFLTSMDIRCCISPTCWAVWMRIEPQVYTDHMKCVRAFWQRSQIFTFLKLTQAHGAFFFWTLITCCVFMSRDATNVHLA